MAWCCLVRDFSWWSHGPRQRYAYFRECCLQSSTLDLTLYSVHHSHALNVCVCSQASCRGNLRTDYTLCNVLWCYWRMAARNLSRYFTCDCAWSPSSYAWVVAAHLVVLSTALSLFFFHEFAVYGNICTYLCWLVHVLNIDLTDL